jgi:hypothetical protein
MLGTRSSPLARTFAHLALGVGAIVYPSAASAQSFPATIFGVVRDSTGAGVPSVELWERESGRRTRSDSTGAYVLRNLQPGRAYVEIRRVGYRTMAIDTTLAESERLEVDLTMLVVPRRLAGVTVSERGEEVTRTMLDFDRRRRAGMGVFVTRQQIEEQQPQHLTDMFRTVPGVIVRGGGFGGYSLRIVRGMCQPYYIIDGQYQPGFELDLIPPNDIEGIELYKGSSETPPQFNRMNAVCGVIVVWTRDPEAG